MVLYYPTHKIHGRRGRNAFRVQRARVIALDSEGAPRYRKTDNTRPKYKT